MELNVENKKEAATIEYFPYLNIISATNAIKAPPSLGLENKPFLYIKLLMPIASSDNFTTYFKLMIS